MLSPIISSCSGKIEIILFEGIVLIYITQSPKKEKKNERNLPLRIKTREQVTDTLVD